MIEFKVLTLVFGVFHPFIMVDCVGQKRRKKVMFDVFILWFNGGKIYLFKVQQFCVIFFSQT